jgi:hypothetical protein
MTTRTTPKSGTPLSTDGCPGLPKDPQRIFGQSPVPRRPITGKHPDVTRADATETGNLKDASQPTSMVRG